MKALFLLVFVIPTIQSKFTTPSQFNPDVDATCKRHNFSQTFYTTLNKLMVECSSESIREIEVRNCRFRVHRLGKLPHMAVEKLTIQKCRITEIADHAFENLADTLVELDLSNNFINELPDLRYLTKLKKLILNNNKISSISSQFSNDSVIEYLDLSNNKITGQLTNSTFAGLKHLKSLNLRNNHITELLPHAFSLSNLTTLHLDNNKINHLLHETFNLPSLSHLSLNNNGIYGMSPIVFASMFNLYELNLSNNYIIFLPGDLLDTLGSLNKLSLSNNKIKKLTSNIFKSSSNLTILNLDNNILKNLPADTFKLTTKLTELNLSNNLISHLPVEIFHSLKNLTKLRMSFNNLTELPTGLLSNSPTKEMYFDHNQIEKVSDNALPPFNWVTYVDFSSNNLTTLPEKSFTEVPISENISENEFTPKQIKLDDNPLVCDDKLVWIVEPYNTHPRSDWDGGDFRKQFAQLYLDHLLPGEPVCVAPEKYANQLMTVISFE